MTNEHNQDGVFGGIITDAQAKAAEEKAAKHAGTYKAKGRDSLGRPEKETVEPSQSGSVAPEVTERKRAAMALGVNPERVSDANAPDVVTKTAATGSTLAEKVGLKPDTQKTLKTNAVKQAFGDQAKQ